jgi:hypothetical protein
LSESCFHCKKTPYLIKKLFVCFVSKPRVGPINSKHNNFKWGNIFAGICTLVVSLWLYEAVEYAKNEMSALMPVSNIKGEISFLWRLTVAQLLIWGLSMEHRILKIVNNCLNTNIFSFLETSVSQSSNQYLKVVHFFNTNIN